MHYTEGPHITGETLVQASVSPVAYTGQNKFELGVSGYAGTVEIQKSWGYEIIYTNNELYCCKKLYIKRNSSCSFHLHMEKHETLFVISGTLYIDSTHDKVTRTHEVKPGQAFVVAPGYIHSLRAENTPVTLMEASSPSYDTDSIRIANGYTKTRETDV